MPWDVQMNVSEQVESILQNPYMQGIVGVAVVGTGLVLAMWAVDRWQTISELFRTVTGQVGIQRFDQIADYIEGALMIPQIKNAIPVQFRGQLKMGVDLVQAASGALEGLTQLSKGFKRGVRPLIGGR